MPVCSSCSKTWSGASSTTSRSDPLDQPLGRLSENLSGDAVAVGFGGVEGGNAAEIVARVWLPRSGLDDARQPGYGHRDDEQGGLAWVLGTQGTAKSSGPAAR